MPSRGDRWRWALGPALVVATSACAANPAPRGWLPKAQDVPRWSRGHWIVIEHTHGGGTVVEGELIAMNEREIHVLTTIGLRALPVPHARRATLALYRSEGGRTFGKGFLWSLTHGWLLPFTIVPWIALSIGEDGAPILRHPPRPLGSFRPFARFPQGLPPGLEPADLGPLGIPAR